MYLVKIGELYVHYISLKERDDFDTITEVLFRPHFARKFTKEIAEKIAKKLNGEVIEK